MNSIIEFFKQKSPQQRFLFILGLLMFLVYAGLGVLLIIDYSFFAQLNLPPIWRIAFGVLLILYAAIRFGRIMRKNDDEQ